MNGSDQGITPRAVTGDWQFTTRQPLFDMVNSRNTECSF